MPENNTNKIYKLWPFVDKLNNNYAKLYKVNQYISIAESIILFKGRSSLKQYNPMKPIKQGSKFGHMNKWMAICQSLASTKANMVKLKILIFLDVFGLGEKVILYLTRDLFGKNHKVYFDNYFSFVPLAKYLLLNKVFCCGTIGSNRKHLPTNLKSDKDLTRGQFDHNHDITIYKRMGNKAVNLISNFHGTETDQIQRTQKDGTKNGLVVQNP